MTLGKYKILREQEVEEALTKEQLEREPRYPVRVQPHEKIEACWCGDDHNK